MSRGTPSIMLCRVVSAHVISISNININIGRVSLLVSTFDRACINPKMEWGIHQGEVVEQEEACKHIRTLPATAPGLASRGGRDSSSGPRAPFEHIKSLIGSTQIGRAHV